MRSLNFILASILASPLTLLQGPVGPGPCHPFPGADAQDCLQLIGDNLNSEIMLPCKNGRASITLRECAISTKCGAGDKRVRIDDVVRRALTTIGNCALNDYGSISGFYIAKSGAKTCYLYPGNEDLCD